MKILITSPSLNPEISVNGISAVVCTIISHSKHEYVHYELGQGDSKSSYLKRVVSPLIQIFRYPFFLYSQRVDLVHDNLPFNAKGILREFLIVLFSKMLRRKVLIHIHGGEYLMHQCRRPLLNWVIRILFKLSDAIIVLSRREQESLLKLYNVHSEILHNPVDVDLYKPQTRKPSEKKRLIFIGRIHESKGIEDIVDAIKIAYPSHPFKLSVCGVGALSEYFSTSCQKIMGDDFEFNNVVSGEKKLLKLNESDIFILPSRYGEGMPIALLEAMSMGLIPIVSDDASMKDIVIDRQNGFFTLKRNPLDLAQKIIFATTISDDDAKIISTNARKTVLDAFNTSVFINNLESVYHNIYK